MTITVPNVMGIAVLGPGQVGIRFPIVLGDIVRFESVCVVSPAVARAIAHDLLRLAKEAEAAGASAEGGA